MIIGDKTLYFDIDGTILRANSGKTKTHLSAGGFERALREAGFTRLVCVSSAVQIIRQKQALGLPVETHPLLFDLCGSAFTDPRWFAETVILGNDPDHRVRFIDRAHDWWYVDDLAERYCHRDGMTDLFKVEHGYRIFAPTPDGDGADVRDWILETGRPRFPVEF